MSILGADKDSQRREHVLSLFVEHSPAAIAMFDREMRYIVVSRRYLVDYEIGDKDIIGCSHYEVFPEIPDRWKEIHKRCLNGEVLRAEEDPFPRASGKVDWVHWEIHPWYEHENEIGGIILFSEVITARKLAEESLREERRRLSNIIESTHAGTWEWNVQTGELVFNEAWAQFIGYTLEELIPVTIDKWKTLIHPDDLDRNKILLERHLADELPFYETEHRMRHKDGHWIWVHSRGRVITRTPDGKPLMMFGTHSDITERKMKEEEQRRTQHLLAISQRLAHIGSWESDLVTGTIRWSDEMYRILACPPEMTINLQTILSLFSPEEAGRFTAAIAATLRGEAPYNMEYTITLNNGQSRVIHDEGEVVFDEKGTAVRMLGTMQDITERKKAEEALTRSEEKFSKAFRVTPEAISITSIETGEYIDVNDVFLKISGFRREDVIGRTANDLNIWVDLNERLHYIQLLNMKGSVKNFETRFRMHSGELRDFLVSSEILDLEGKRCTLNFILDITDRKRAEAEVRESELKLKKAQHYAHLGSWTWNIRTNHLDWSDEMFHIFGVEKETFTGSLESVIARAIHPDDRTKVEESNNSVVQQQRPIPLEYRIVWPDGSVRTVWAEAGELMLDEAGNPSLLSGTVQDITERKQDEERLRRMEERLRRSEKMEAVGQLAGGIAHDFNNVLGGIIGFTDLSLNYAEKGSMLEANLLKVLKAADRAKHLVKQILAFSRQGNPQRSITSLTPIVKEVLELLRSSIPSSVIIETDLNDDARPVQADPTQIHQTLLNLATNAVHAMHRKGTLTVRLYPRVLVDPEYGQVGEIQPGSYTILEVADTGTGMDALTKSKAFEPFFTTKAVGEGTGMGLSVVLGVVQSHGGDLQLESEPGKGTVIRIFLPAADESAADSGDHVPPIISLGKERLLFVDDELMLVEMANTVLAAHGYTVHGMSDGVAALKFLREHSDDIDMIITDQTMPGVTGTELAAEARRIRKDIPVILCTGYSNVINAEQTAALGINLLVMKPYRPHEISKFIRDVFDSLKK
jgi:PAS domain S-box-containing protein